MLLTAYFLYPVLSFFVILFSVGSEGMRSYYYYNPDRKRGVTVQFGISFVIYAIITLAMLNPRYNQNALVFSSSLATLYFLFIAIYINTYKPPYIPPMKSTDHGSARWSTREEFETAIGHNDEQGIPGLLVGSTFIRRASGHLMTVASPGSGKGAALLIPNLLSAPCGSYVVTDPKGENACITAKAQKDEWRQKVYILDPWDEQTAIGAKHGIPSAGFNPFDMLRMDMEALPDNCEMVASYLIPQNPQSKNPYWEDRGRSIIKMMLMHIVTAYPLEEQTFWTLYKLLRNDKVQLGALYMQMQANTAYDGLISAGGSELASLLMSSETFGGVISQAQNGTRLFESIQLRKSLEKSDFNPYDLANGNCTVYINIPERYMESHAAWLRIITGLSLKAVNAKPNKRVIFLIDEAAVLGKMEDVKRGYAYGRGQNITMWTFFQSFSQIKEVYGEAGMNSLLNATKHLTAFNLNDQYSKEIISKALGEETLEKMSYSESDNGESTSYSTFARPLMTAEEVGKCKAIISIGNDFKFLVKKDFYFDKNSTFGDSLLEMANPAPRIH